MIFTSRHINEHIAKCRKMCVCVYRNGGGDRGLIIPMFKLIYLYAKIYENIFYIGIHTLPRAYIHIIYNCIYIMLLNPIWFCSERDARNFIPSAMRMRPCRQQFTHTHTRTRTTTTIIKFDYKSSSNYFRIRFEGIRFRFKRRLVTKVKAILVSVKSRRTTSL